MERVFEITMGIAKRGSDQMDIRESLLRVSLLTEEKVAQNGEEYAYHDLARRYMKHYTMEADRRVYCICDPVFGLAGGAVQVSGRSGDERTG